MKYMCVYIYMYNSDPSQVCNISLQLKKSLNPKPADEAS